MSPPRYAHTAPDVWFSDKPGTAPLPWAADLLITECIAPNVDFKVDDDVTTLMKDRRMRAVLAKHDEAIRRAFLVFSSTDESDMTPGQGSDKVDRHALVMNLLELMTLLKEAGMLDESCSARAVLTFFVKVNLRDELYLDADGSTHSHTQLEYKEFTEVLSREARRHSS